MRIRLILASTFPEAPPSLPILWQSDIMSTLPTPQESWASTSPATSSTTPPRFSETVKPKRVLACILCHQRKIKCDRKSPCSHCIKAGVQCVPAIDQPRPRRRRFPERILLERLRKYEDLLRQNNVKFDPLHKDVPEGKDGLSPTGDSDDEYPDTARLNQPPSRKEFRTETEQSAKYACFPYRVK